MEKPSELIKKLKETSAMRIFLFITFITSNIHLFNQSEEAGRMEKIHSWMERLLLPKLNQIQIAKHS